MLEILFLLAVGLVGGIISALVGGASLVTFPALVATGLSPIAAVIVSLVALTPANLSAAWWDRGKLPPLTAPFWWMLLVACAGSILGAWLLLVTPEKVFAVIVPFLLALATVLFAYAEPISRWIEKGSANEREAERSRWVATTAGIAPVAIYSGYFGAGAGVMLLAILMVIARGDYRVANAAKNLVAGVNCLVASLVCVAMDRVVWRPVILTMMGGLLGALIGVRISRVAPRETMRRVVIASSVVMTLVFAWRYWL